MTIDCCQAEFGVDAVRKKTSNPSTDVLMVNGALSLTESGSFINFHKSIFFLPGWMKKANCF